MPGTLSVLHATLATHSRGPAMAVRELEAFRAVLRELLIWIGERADDRSSANAAPVYPDALRALHRRRAEGFEG